MKFKKIMLVTVVLLAILTIGAVSASEDVTSDDSLTVGDDADIVADGTEPDPNDGEKVGSGENEGEEELRDVNFWVDDENDFTDEDGDEVFGGATIKKGIEGNITVTSGEQTFFNKALSDFENPADYDEDDSFSVYNILFKEVGMFKDLQDEDTFIMSFSEDSQYDMTFIVYVDEDYGTYSFDIFEGDDDEEDFEISAVDNFDINDPEATVIIISSPEAVPGTFYVEWESRGTLKRISIPIDESDWDEYNMIYISASTLEIPSDADDEYFFLVFYRPSGEEIDWGDHDVYDTVIADINANGRDYNSVWVDVERIIHELLDDNAVSFYCADESEGSVVIDVYEFDDETDIRQFVGSYSKNIADNVDKWLYWSAEELGLKEDVLYELNITYGDYSALEHCSLESPVQFNPEPSYIGSDDGDRIGILAIVIPSDMGASIKININGTSIWLETDDFTEWDEDTTGDDELYWTYYRYFGNEDTSLKVYNINILNLKGLDDDHIQEIVYPFEEGIYNINVTLWVDGEGPTRIYSRQGSLTVYSTNTKREGDTSISFYDKEPVTVWEDEWSIIKVVFPDGENRTVKVTLVDGDKLLYEDKDFDDELSVCVTDLKLPEGTYELRVTLFDGNTEILNHTATISVIYGSQGIMNFYVPEKMRYYDEAIRVYFAIDDIDGEVIILIDGVEYFRTHADGNSLVIDDEDGFLSLFVGLQDLDMQLAPGHYGTVEIFYYGIDGTEEYDVFNDGFEVFGLEPSIWIAGWPVHLQDDDIIFVDPADDDSEDIRIVLKIADEVYLNATVEELGLTLKKDDEGRYYYRISPDMLEKPISFDIHENVIAYYISDNYNISSADGEDPQTTLIIDGILNEVEHNYTGPVIAVYFSENEGEITIWMEGKEEPITETVTVEGMYYWTLDDLGLGEGYRGFVDVDYGHDMFGGEIWVVNNDEFRAKADDVLLIIRNQAAVFVFCPQGSAGMTINLSFYDGEKYPIREYVIEEGDQGNYVEFTLDDLEITEEGYYRIAVSVPEISWSDICEFGVTPVMQFPQNGIVTISDGEDYPSTEIVDINLPYGFEGYLIITVDGIAVFNENLDDISCEDYGDFMHYVIFTSDLDDVSEGRHRVVVTCGDIVEEKTITFAQRNVNSNGDISIEMFSVSCDKGDWGNYFARIEVPMDSSFNITNDLKVYINNTLYEDDLDWWDEDDWDKDTKIYYLAFIPDNFGEVGKHTVTVVCNDENGDEIVRNTDTVTLFVSPEIFVMWSDFPDNNEVVYDIGSDNMIHIYPNGETNFRIIVMIGGKVYFNATSDELGDINYETNPEHQEYFTIGPANFTKAIAPGDYNDIVAIFSCENTDVYSNDGGMPDYATITGEPLDADFNIEIANVEEGNPIVVKVTASEAFTGDVIVKVGENEILVHIEDGEGINDDTGVILPVGNGYVANLTYAATVSFKEAFAETNFDVTAKKSDDKGDTTPGGDGKANPSGSGTGTTQPAKKAATKIIAKKKTFKAKKKVKKYTITLKSGKKVVKGVKVTLKVGKKTYKAKTNKKGKATFKITKLKKKGKYKAVIKFAGTKLYKATKKTVKITVKK